ncbi:hypothetical protein TNCT_76101 [Trichonephila clavata]|uniref:Uncharacterized protein n=1 Tax=Trichonephila clavata TaxID=2740835 RepID=A0A8X6LFB6_TRICU|nr:hypothetical protein TNCT_76101 [Trichonephila clavata]
MSIAACRCGKARQPGSRGQAFLRGGPLWGRQGQGISSQNEEVFWGVIGTLARNQTCLLKLNYVDIRLAVKGGRDISLGKVSL